MEYLKFSETDQIICMKSIKNYIFVDKIFAPPKSQVLPTTISSTYVFRAFNEMSVNQNLNLNVLFFNRIFTSTYILLIN